MKSLQISAFIVVSCAIAGCSGSNGISVPPNPTRSSAPGPVSPAPAVTPTPTPTPTPTAPPTSVSTTQTVNNGMAVSNAPVTMPFAAPPGYGQSVSIPLVTTRAGTMITLTAGTTVPSGLAPLSGSRLPAARRPDVPGSFNTIFYDSIVPSADITVAGNVVFNESLPAGVLAPGTSYYVAFFDTTKPAPAWQTIVGPVTPSGNALAFSGTISATTLLANKQYGFAIFSGATPTTTPPPAPQTLLYFADNAGLTVAQTDGTIVKTLAIPSQTFDLDDVGNVYSNDAHHGGSAPGMGGSSFFAMYPAGSSTPNAPYVPSVARGFFVAASGAGEAIAVHNLSNAGVLTTDVWDPGVTDAPSRIITTNVPGGNSSFVLAHDGTIYLPDVSAAGVPQFDIFPPGSTTPSKVIPETLVSPSQYKNFAPNYSAVASDGTLYVTEYSFQQPDPLAGTYVYPLNGPERFIPAASNAQGPGPQGIDIDGSGNIYVVNNNSAVLTSTTCQGDSLQSVSVYDKTGALARTVTGAQGFPVTAAVDGRAFVSSFRAQLQSSCPLTGSNGIYAIAPGASTATQISPMGSSSIVLFDGTHKTEPFSRSAHGSGGRGGHGGGAHFLAPTRR